MPDIEQVTQRLVGRGQNAAIDPTGTSDGVRECLKWMQATLNTIAGSSKLEVQPNDIDAFLVDERVSLEAKIFDDTTGPISSGDITPGTYELERSRSGGVWTTVATGQAFSKADGEINADFILASANWQEDDQGRIKSNNDTTAVIDGDTYYVAIPMWRFRVTSELTIKQNVASIKTQTDKLAGETPLSSSTTADWNAAEADIISIGANDTKKKFHSFIASMASLTATATITFRAYVQVNGVETKIYDENFVVGTDPDGVIIINGIIAIGEAIRITAQSDNALDDGKAISYEGLVEAM